MVILSAGTREDKGAYLVAQAHGRDAYEAGENTGIGVCAGVCILQREIIVGLLYRDITRMHPLYVCVVIVEDDTCQDDLYSFG